MSEQKVESVPTGEESSQGSDKPSTPVGGQQASPSIEDVLKELDTKVADAVNRGLQAQKDRRISGLESSVKSFSERLDEFDKLAEDVGNRALAKELVSIREQLSSRTQLTESSPEAASEPTGAKFGKEIEGILQAGNLDPNDPDVIALVRQYENNTLALVTAVLSKGGGAEPLPSSGAVAQPSGTGAPQPQKQETYTQADYEAWGAELIELQNKGSQRTAKDETRREELKALLDEHDPMPKTPILR